MLPKYSFYVLCLYLIIVFLDACGTTANKPDMYQHESAPLEFLPALKGDYFKFDSNAVGRSFHIYVRFPQDYDKNADVHYPVIYVLDGDSLFPILAANHVFLNYDDDLPEAVVVGISYGSFDPKINKRGFDFSAPADDAKASQGGAPQFHMFLKLELLPEIEKRYLVDPNRRILFGQSRGGYMVLYSAFTDPDLFWGRVASNPSLDPGRKLLFSPAAPSTKKDLKLVFTSGTHDIPSLREGALIWFDEWKNRNDAPWEVMTFTIENGTHAADAINSYRFALKWLFNKN